MKKKIRCMHPPRALQPCELPKPAPMGGDVNRPGNSRLLLGALLGLATSLPPAGYRP